MTRLTSNLDPYSDENLFDPYPLYKQLRGMGGAIWMDRYDCWAVSRYDNVRAALDNWQVFSSAQGISLNAEANEATKGTLIASDPPIHDAMRKVFIRPLTPPAIRELEPLIEAESERLIARLMEMGRFDAATTMAQHLPLTIVSKLVGVPEDGRERMLDWSLAAFNSKGPDNERSRKAGPIIGEFVQFVDKNARRDRLVPGGWADQLFQAAERGEIPEPLCVPMLIDYLAPSLDTTIAATQFMMRRLAMHPEQWQQLRDDPSKIASAINEVIRIDSPLISFSRATTQDTEVDGQTIPAGARILLLYASANRDERKWHDPDRFDVTRNAADHLGFGRGTHACAGNLLARLEIRSLIKAMLPRVARLELHNETFQVSNSLRSYPQMDMTFHAA